MRRNNHLTSTLTVGNGNSYLMYVERSATELPAHGSILINKIIIFKCNDSNNINNATNEINPFSAAAVLDYCQIII